MEPILLETDDSPEASERLALLRSIGVNLREIPIRWGDPTVTSRGLPPLWADRPELDKAKLREITWGKRR